MFKKNTNLIVLSLFLLNSGVVFTGDAMVKPTTGLLVSAFSMQVAGDLGTEETSDPLGLFEPIKTARAWTGFRDLKDSFELPRTKDLLRREKDKRAQQIKLVQAMGVQTNLDEPACMGPVIPVLGAVVHAKKD